MKYKEGNFFQVYKEAIRKLNQQNKKVPYSIRWLYICLNLLEHRFAEQKDNFFFRSIEDLQSDIGMGRRQIIEGIKSLEKLELIQTWQMHWIDKKTKKKSEKHITAFRVLGT